MTFFSGIDFFVVLVLACIPAVALGVLEKNLKYYRLLASIGIVGYIFSNELKNLVFLLAFVVGEMLLIKIYLELRKKSRNAFTYRLFLFLSILPLILAKVSEVTSLSLFQFLGISYLTFRVAQVIIEIYDGLIKEVKVLDYLDFILLFSTFSSGPIDRSRRFLADSSKVLQRKEYLDLVGTGLIKIIIGLFYKVVLSALMYLILKEEIGCCKTGLEALEYAYVYGFYMFFDFAGYSLMAIGTSYIFGIKTPENFHLPFVATNMKDFWNRWHMTLSYWFRDFIFSRLMMTFIRGKYFKSRLTGASVAFITNMTVMGLWHGLDWQYIIYGVYHGILLAINEAYEKKCKFHKKNKNQWWYKGISWFITINLVMLGFFIFSGQFTKAITLIIGK